MEIIDDNALTQVNAGNAFVIPMFTAVTIGFCGGVLAWTLKTAYKGDTEAFSAWQNYVIEGSIGVTIASVASLSFLFAI